MNKRPFAVTVVGILIMIAAAFGLARGFSHAKTIWPPEQDLIWVVVVDVIGIACGVFLLRGKNWARWLTLLWLASHVVFSFFNSPQEVLVHGILLVLIAYLLALRSDVRAYFRVDETE